MGEATDHGRLGTLGDVSFLSLGRGKAFSVVEGGIILTNRDDIAERLQNLIARLPRYGVVQTGKLLLKAVALAIFIHPRLYWIPKNLPHLKLGETLYEAHFPILKMSSFQAGLARNWERRLASLRDVRKKNVSRWIDTLKETRGRASSVFGGQSLGLLRFPVRLSDKKDRESLLQQSAESGMGIMPVYPTSIDAIPELKGKIEGGPFPVAARCASELVTLPTHGYLTDDDARAIDRLISPALGWRRSEILNSSSSVG
jgi:perosamine synthetase